MKSIFLFSFLALISSTIFCQTEMKPEDTEVWEPEPKVVTPGIGSAAPSDAIVLFDGKNMQAWEIPENSFWTVKNGIVSIEPSLDRQLSPVSIRTKQKFGDMQLHVEWKSPAEVKGEGQRRGNSGILIQGKYEIQVLDNYNNRTYSNGQTASVYKQTIPLVNACKAPGEWQIYDIVYKSPRFNENGTLLEPAVVTVLHNGILVQNATEILGSIKFIGLPEYVNHPLKESLYLQDHGDAVSYRNIWIREL